MTTKKRSKRRAPAKRSGFWRRHRWKAFHAFLMMALFITAFLLWTDRVVRMKFEGARWELPARVFARPMELYPGLAVTSEEIAAELTALGYRVVDRITGPGQFAVTANRMQLYSRGFTFWDGPESGAHINLRFAANRISELSAGSAQEFAALVRLEPREIAKIFPRHKEDRLLVRFAEVPVELVDAIIAVEDRSFFAHHGLDFWAIARAALVNLTAGRIEQGGSTITQQLVKNLYLQHERTWWRKFNEVVMALLLEQRYSKEEIFEAYLNEIYLGQDGERAIHGFGLAAQHYFGRPLIELAPQQLALLAALPKGASYYNPRRHPARARDRRNLVIRVMRDLGKISTARAAQLAATPLGLASSVGRAGGRHPGFLDLVRRQLRIHYREKDLRSAGLQIFTTLDPAVQQRAEQVVATTLSRLESGRGLPAKSLQAALVTTVVATGEVVAMVAGRDARFPGFNHVLDARRQIGSLIKPVVYLTALREPQRYSVASTLDDEALELVDGSGQLWRPDNYDRLAHGPVSLRTALVHSYNLASARLGLDLGYAKVRRTLRDLGAQIDLPEYPSVFLGAVEMTPLEVAQVYQTMASGGFRTPVSAIRAVVDRDGGPLQRYGLEIEQTVGSGESYLLQYLLTGVINDGTARTARSILAPSLPLAGKTGTTDDLRDSWFAGYGDNVLTVVWVGRDDNQPAGLTGASGALPIWAALMRDIAVPLTRPAPKGISWHTVTDDGTELTDGGCPGAVQAPFLAVPESLSYRACKHPGVLERGVDALGGLFR